MKAASLVSDCFPEPPTPTIRQLPEGELMILVSLSKCLSASSKITNDIFFDGNFSLQRSSLSTAFFLIELILSQASQTYGASATISSSSFFTSSYQKSANRYCVCNYSGSYPRESQNLSFVIFSRMSLNYFLSSLLMSLSSNTLYVSCRHRPITKSYELIFSLILVWF